MLINKFSFVIVCILLGMLSLSCVNAVDSNNGEISVKSNDLLVSNEFTINSGGDFADIQKAVDNSKDGDTIILNGEFNSRGNDTITVNKHLTFTSTNGSVLNGKNKTIIFLIQSNAIYSKFSNLKLINGYSINEGGAMRINAKSVTVDNCIFENNYAQLSSGAIHTPYKAITSESLTISNCNFINNSAGVAAGAVGAFSNKTKIENCIFDSNHVFGDNNCYGGAIQIGLDIDISFGTVLNCTFKNNWAKSSNIDAMSHGGAGCIRNGSSYLNCLFIDNYADHGGALTFHGTGKVENSTFINNQADLWGGAISTTLNDINLNLVNCNFKENLAPYGGAVQLMGTHVSILGSNFDSNIATVTGGAVNIDSNSITVNDCNFTKNQGIYGGAILFKGSILNLKNSNFLNNSALFGGAVFIEESSTAKMFDVTFNFNKALNGSAIYNNGTLNINNSYFGDNQAKSYLLTSHNASVRQGELLVIVVYYECGDNILDAIYNNGSILINSRLPYQSSSCSNQKVFLLLNNITYDSITNFTGHATFYIKTTNFNEGNYTYLIGHEENSMYSTIFNSSFVEIIKNPFLDKNQINKSISEKSKISSNDDDKNLSDISSNNFLKMVKNNKFQDSFYPISKKYYQNCGAKVLKKLLASKGIHVKLQVLINKLNTKDGQTSIFDIIRVAKEYGVTLYANKMPLKDLKKGDIVLINFNGKNHFITIYYIDKNHIIYDDPDLGHIKISISEFESYFSGYTLTFNNVDSLSDDEINILGGFMIVDDATIGMLIILSLASMAMISMSKDNKNTKTSTIVKNNSKSNNNKKSGGDKGLSKKSGSSKGKSNNSKKSNKSYKKYNKKNKKNSKKSKKSSLEKKIENNSDEKKVWRRAISRCSKEKVIWIKKKMPNCCSNNCSFESI